MPVKNVGKRRQLEFVNLEEITKAGAIFAKAALPTNSILILVKAG